MKTKTKFQPDTILCLLFCRRDKLIKVSTYEKIRIELIKFNRGQNFKR